VSHAQEDAQAIRTEPKKTFVAKGRVPKVAFSVPGHSLVFQANAHLVASKRDARSAQPRGSLPCALCVEVADANGLAKVLPEDTKHRQRQGVASGQVWV